MIYRGRIAPSPTGFLHLGHAMTFWRAQQRAHLEGGKLVLRLEDLDPARCQPEFRDAIIEDLRWFGLRWDEGPDLGGPFAPYDQSSRLETYRDRWKELLDGGFIYSCGCSRQDVWQSAGAPHHENEEPVYPGTCRPAKVPLPVGTAKSTRVSLPPPQQNVHWRFRVPEGEQMSFVDLRLGEQRAIVGKDFGDFIVWRKDDVPAYQLAVVVDDAAMEISEVVRGADLLLSTFRQLLLYRALGLSAPRFYHADLIRDSSGRRLAKRHASLSLRALRESGADPAAIRGRSDL